MPRNVNPEDMSPNLNKQIVGEIEKLLKDYECRYLDAETLVQALVQAPTNSSTDGAIPALRELEDLAEYLFLELEEHFKPAISCSSCKGL